MRPRTSPVAYRVPPSGVLRRRVGTVVLFIAAWKDEMTDVGAELRRIRENLDISGSAVARDLGWSQSKISRVETGRFGASVSEIAQLLHYYGVAEEVRAEILAAVARSSGLEGAWVVSAGGPPRRQSGVEEVESRVKRLRQYHASWIPGLLQTAAYATGVCEAAGFKPDEVVPLRMHRQEVMDSRKRVKYQVVIDESVLCRAPRVASTDMADQMTVLLDRIGSGYVDLRVVPLGGRTSVFVAGTFVLYQFTAAPSVVLCEAQTADLYLSAERDIAAYQRLFAGLWKDALDATGTCRAIESARRDWAS